MKAPDRVLRRGLGPAAAALLAGSCSGPQSMIDPAGPGADAINTMWWVLLALLTVIFLLVMGALGYALFRRRDEEGGGGGPSGAGDREAERRRVIRVLVAGGFLPLLILVGLFVYTMRVLNEVGPTQTEEAPSVVVIGKQFWWDIRYPLPGGDTVRTANELHIPAGRRVTLRLESSDVIHSLWVPRLHGKVDMIPGRTNTMWLEAEEPGIYRGQCAEYCGAQHAWMALLVVAHPAEEFEQWLREQSRPAAAGIAAAEPPEGITPLRGRALRGLEVYLDPEHRCTACHVIRGVNEPTEGAGGQLMEGPDLTHVASRRIMAGGLLAVNRGNMGGWLANPQVLKPGNLMPRIPLEPDELQALVAYLMTLE